MAEPKLRFSGFSGNWIQSTIGKSGDFYYGRSCPKWSVTADATTPCVRYGELYTKFNNKIDKVYSYTNIDPTILRLSKGTEVLVPRVGEDRMDYNHCAWLSIPNVAIGEMISVYNTENNPLFIAMMFNAKLKEEFAKRVEGGSVTNLYYEKIKDIVIFYPCPEEQQKIADFLSSVDEVIATSEQEVANLETLKKVVMKKIFSQEVRFKRADGSDYPDWEDTTVKEIGVVVTGNTPSTKEEKNYGQDYLWVTPADITKNEYVSSTNKRLSEKGWAIARHLPAGAVLVTCIASIGKNSILATKGSCNQQINAIIPNGKMQSRFILEAINYKEHDLQLLGGNGGMKIVSKSLFENFELPYPCPEEQQKIADFLSNFDEAITSAKKELELWKELKKGLLQQMFV